MHESTNELLLAGIVAAVQVLTLVLQQVIAHRRHQRTLTQIKRESAEVLRVVSGRPPPRSSSSAPPPAAQALRRELGRRALELDQADDVDTPSHGLAKCGNCGHLRTSHDRVLSQALGRFGACSVCSCEAFAPWRKG